MRPHRVIGIVSEPMIRAERLFGDLDGCDICSANGTWVACVLGIHVEGNEAWVQLSLVGEAPCSLVVHLHSGATSREAIGAISVWLDCPPIDRSTILEVR